MPPSNRSSDPDNPFSRTGRLRKAAGNVLPWFGGIVLLVQLAWVWSQWGTPLATSVDSSQFLVMARRLAAGLELYRPWPEYGPHFMTPNGPVFPPERSPYPPFVAALLTPLAGMELTTWARLIWCVTLVGFWGYALTLAALHGRATPRRVFAWATILMLTPDAWRAVAIGNIDPLLWFIVGTAFVSRRVRGGLLTLAALIKVYPVWPLAVAVYREPRRVLPAASATVALVSGAAAIAVGPVVLGKHLVAWLSHVPPLMAQGSFLFWNFSVSFLPLRILAATGLWDYTSGPLDLVPRIYLTALAVAAPMVVAWLTRHCNLSLQCGVVLAAAVLFAPLGWATYLPFVLAPLAILTSPKGTPVSFRANPGSSR